MNLGRYNLKNSNPRYKAPVPERDWQVITLLSFTAWLFSPKRRFLAPEQNYGDPSIGKYSLIKLVIPCYDWLSQFSLKLP